jgi:4-hydroxy-2-oxoheptanedioate aldolase
VTTGKDAGDTYAEPLVGTVLTMPGAILAELMSEPFDVVWVDLEHAALSLGAAADIILGAQAAGALALVRLPAVAHDLIAVSLDAGADGVVLADVGDAETARAAVASTRHPPGGTRGWGPRRAGTRGRRESRKRRPPVVWAQIERAAGVAAAEAIAAVDGIDMLVPGAADLSFALGLALQFEAPELRSAILNVRESARRAGTAFGVAGPLDVIDPTLLVGTSALIHSTEARIAAAAVDNAAALIRQRATQARTAQTLEAT